MIESTREMATLSAETVTALGLHLAHMGQIVSAGVNSHEAVDKIQMEKSRYDKYLASSKDRRKKLELQFVEEQEKMVAYKKQMGGAKGGSLLDELRMLQKKVKELEALLAETRDGLEGERTLRMRLEALQEQQIEKVKNMVKMWMSDGAKKLVPIIVQNWKRFTDSETKFKFKEISTTKDLLVERHRKLRKDSCKRVLKVIAETRVRRLATWCFVGFQEELCERREERLHEELTRRHENFMLIMQAQVAQASGDEEASKAFAAEQTARMEAAYEAVRVAEVQRDDARQAEVEMGEMKKEAEHRTEVALGEKAQALEEKHQAEVQAEECREETKAAKEETRVMNIEKLQAIDEKEGAIIEKQKMARKNEKLQKSLNELGAESDDDEPEEDKPPPWFVDEQGVKQPRPRTRKERFAMAYNETLACRHEMKLQLAVIIDKDMRAEDRIDKLVELVRQQDRCLTQMRYANQALQGDLRVAEQRLETNVDHNPQSPGTTLPRSPFSESYKSASEVLSPLQRVPSSPGALTLYNPKNMAFGKPRASSNASKRKPGTLSPLSDRDPRKVFIAAWR